MFWVSLWAKPGPIVNKYPPSQEDIDANRDPALGIFDRLFNDPDVPEADRLMAFKLWNLGCTYTTGESLAEQERAKPPRDYKENLRTARIVCCFYYQNAFMNPPDPLLQDVGKLKNIPHIFIVNGREDIKTSPKRAYDLHQALKKAGVNQAELKIIENAGHSAWNPHTAKELLASVKAFQAMNEKP